MLTLQVSHQDQLQSLLKQYTSQLHAPFAPFRLPDKALQEISFHVTQLSGEQWKSTLMKSWRFAAPPRFAAFPRYLTITLTAVCHRWRTVLVISALVITTLLRAPQSVVRSSLS